MVAAKRKKKEMTKFPKRMQKKLIVTFLLIAFMLVGLIGRLMYIEYTSGEKYEKIVLSQQEYDSQTIPYQRGDIVDTKGTVLATSVAVYNVILDCSVLTSKENYIEPTITALVTCFPDYVTSDQLYGYVRDSADSRYIVLAKKLPYENIQAFVEMQEAVDDNGKLVNPYIKGVWFEKEYQREYPYNTLASSVIGFTTSGNVGINGLENYYNDTLNGINGREYGYLNSDNNFEKTVKAAQDGNTIVTTIDTNIQSIVESKIAEFNTAYAGNYREGEEGATHIAVLVMNPNNGEVLAMANYPNYDLNNPRDLSAYYTEEELAALSDDEKLDALNNLWQNFCITYTYEPGSTAKPFTVATGLDTGTLTGDEIYYCDGYEMFGTDKVKCVNRSGHGTETVEQALMNSCNDALMQMSYSIGVENFTTYQQIFGFGQKTNIDLPGETRTDSLIYTAENMKSIDLATNAFGQNFNTTMIQMATAFSSLVNGGELYQPHMVKKITDSEGNTIEEIEPTLLRETVSDTTSDKIKEYLYSVVGSGTGSTAKVDGYSMGGKTGTAQKTGRDGVNYLVSFIGYAPQDNPELVIYCVVDEPNVASQSHSTYAQNIVREILKELFPYMGIYQDEELTGANNTYTITGAPNSSTSPANQASAESVSPEAVPDSVVQEEEGDALPEGEDNMPVSQESGDVSGGE
ncbi:MAG: peptidoglycan D,D-transpeptidase FtsI family protein [Roseburia sp.]